MTVFPVKTSLFKHTGFSCADLGVEMNVDTQNGRYGGTSYGETHTEVAWSW